MRWTASVAPFLVGIFRRCGGGAQPASAGVGTVAAVEGPAAGAQWMLRAIWRGAEDGIMFVAKDASP